MEKTFAVQNDFSDAVTRYLQREQGKGKDIIRTMNRIMSYWLLNAMRRVPRESREEIGAYLMTKVSTGTRLPATRRKRAAVVEEMRNTMAAIIINKTDYGNARALRKAGNSTGYFQLARTYQRRRQFSGGFLKSGFLEGLRVRRAPTDGSKPPNYRKHATGDSPAPTVTPNEIAMQVSNFAGLIGELFPGAFNDGLAELNARLSSLMLQDLLTGANTAGLNAKRA